MLIKITNIQARNEAGRFLHMLPDMEVEAASAEMEDVRAAFERELGPEASCHSFGWEAA